MSHIADRIAEIAMTKHADRASQNRGAIDSSMRRQKTHPASCGETMDGGP
jgi:hypothetical protein